MSWAKERQANAHYRKAYKRLSKIPVGQVQDWAMTSVWAVQAGLEGFQQTNDAAALHEAQLGAVGLQAAIAVLLDRAV